MLFCELVSISLPWGHKAEKTIVNLFLKTHYIGMENISFNLGTSPLWVYQKNVTVDLEVHTPQSASGVTEC